MRLRSASLVIAAAALTAVGTLAGSGVASAANAPAKAGLIAVGNGTVGVSQTVSVIAPSLHDTTVALTAAIGSNSAEIDVALNSRGLGNAEWVPTVGGTWTIAPVDSSVALAPASPYIALVPTVTSIFVPDKTERFEPMPLEAVVSASGSDQPVIGTVTFYEVYRGRLGAVDLVSLPLEHSIARFSWTPPAEGDYAFYATFTPGTSTTNGIAAFEPSQSAISRVRATTHPVAIQLLMPPVMYTNTPALVMARLPHMFKGTVALMVDGSPVTDPKDTVNGYIAFRWTPLHSGLTYVTLDLQSDRYTQLEREVTQTINVLPKPVANPMSVTPVIDGVPQAPWQDDDVLSYEPGTTIDLVTSTGNGAGVNFSQRGMCALDGLRLVVPATGGGCVVTFSSVGDSQFAGNSASVLITASVSVKKAS